MSWASFVCADPQHIGERFITGEHSYEERLEWRRMRDQRDRRNVRVMAPICRECRDYRIQMARGGRISQQGSFFPGEVAR